MEKVVLVPMVLTAATVDADVNVCVDADDDVILGVNTVMVVHLLIQYDPKIDCPIHVEEDLPDQLLEKLN